MELTYCADNSTEQNRFRSPSVHYALWPSPQSFASYFFGAIHPFNMCVTIPCPNDQTLLVKHLGFADRFSGCVIKHCSTNRICKALFWKHFKKVFPRFKSKNVGQAMCCSTWPNDQHFVWLTSSNMFDQQCLIVLQVLFCYWFIYLTKGKHWRMKKLAKPAPGVDYERCNRSKAFPGWFTADCCD